MTTQNTDRSTHLCLRCWTGIDNNNDGDCLVCCKLTGVEAKELALKNPMHPENRFKGYANHNMVRR